MRDVVRRRPVWIALASVAYLGAAAWLDRQGRREPTGSYDAIVVLGCRVRPDGRASLALERRARHAAHLYHRGLAPLVVATGGVGTHPPSEARAAAAVLRAEGVPDPRIVLEEVSTSTEENAREAARRITGTRVLIVTDAYHTFRARLVFLRHFDEVAAAGSLGSRSVRARGALREVTAVAAYAVLGRL
jgi:uncharacterized SAM-binding protein YcdF (DUF218 family)